jgi:hypothetical protein
MYLQKSNKQITIIYRYAVLWIRDILIRIRFRGSVQLSYVLDPAQDPALFVQWLSRCQQKIGVFCKFFLLITF